MPTPSPITYFELLAALRRGSCNLPTLVVEGSDDVRIYRWIKEALGLQPFEITLLSANERGTLLKVYEAVCKDRHLYADVPIVFIADQDMFLFKGIPSKYSGVVFTSGYSIENDLYSFADLEQLLDPPDETSKHKEVLNVIIEWFAFEVDEDVAGRTSCIGRKLEKIVPKGTTTMDPEFRKTRGFRSSPKQVCPPKPETHKKIKNDYKLKLRGKTLFDILDRYLNNSGRHTKHRKENLQEIAFKTPSNPQLKDELIKKIKKKIIEEKRMLTSFASKRGVGAGQLTIHAQPKTMVNLKNK